MSIHLTNYEYGIYQSAAARALKENSGKIALIRSAEEMWSKLQQAFETETGRCGAELCH